MKDSIRLGRLSGVAVGVHWSLIAMVALVAVGLANNRFAVEAPGYGRGAYVLAGVLTAFGLLASVLAHEFGHALLARRKGLEVGGITLSWMGGVTRIEGDTGRPGVELMVAGIGPSTSLVAGGLFWGAREIAVSAGSGPLVLAALGWLVWMNVALAVFNILPAAPLDGGRVLHAVVWALGRDRWRATRIAAGAGMVVGALFIAAGFVATDRNGDLFDGVLISFVGWWLLASARAELGTGAVQRTLEGVRIGDIMRPVGEAPGWLTVRAFVDQYAGNRPGWVWLLRSWDGGYGGLIASEAVAAVPWPQWELARPLDVAVPISAAVEAAPEEDAMDALTRIGGGRVLLAVAGGHTVGALLPSDVEALVRSGVRGASVRGRRPAPWRV